MADDNDIHVRPGRIGFGRPAQTATFLQRALRAAGHAGGMHARTKHSPSFGRGRAGAAAAGRALVSRSRGAVVKARVIKMGRTPGALGANLRYLCRDGTMRDGERGQMFGAEVDTVDGQVFADRCRNDRHHFRFIVSPDDAQDLQSLRTFARDLMRHAEVDLGTKLDWVAADHWNTEHPHIHIVVRGKTDRDQDLVISRDYIANGMRARASQLVTIELGPKTEIEMVRELERMTEADRWTRLDRELSRVAHDGVLDLRPEKTPQVGDPAPMLARARKLESLGFAQRLGPAEWRISSDLPSQLRGLGERDDIIKQMHRSLRSAGIDRQWSEPEATSTPIIGRLVDRGLSDELKGTAWVIVDGVDGRAHHLRFASLEATTDCAPGGIVEFVSPAENARPGYLVVRSDLPLERLVQAEGATWLDRQLVARQRLPLSSHGFGAETEQALARREQILVERGLAERIANGFQPRPGLLSTLKERELAAVSRQIAARTGLAAIDMGEGQPISGTLRQRITLASGRFAMLDDGLGFQLVPWSKALDDQLGRELTGTLLPGGKVEWSLGRSKGLEL
jgi:type IV secretory pathway VirD2 relaxase